MTDTELQALAVLATAEVSAMNAQNSQRFSHGQAMAYGDADYLGLDCVRCLDAELRRRKLLVTPGAKGAIQ